MQPLIANARPTTKDKNLLRRTRHTYPSYWMPYSLVGFAARHDKNGSAYNCP